MGLPRERVRPVTYDPSPTFVRFHNSDSRVRCVVGPVGSGKSSGCLMEGWLFRAMKQAPDLEGVRKTRGMIIRNTYSELRMSTIKTFDRWVPGAIKTWHGEPLWCLVKMPLADGTRIECEIYFVSIDRPQDAEKLGSTEFTWIYFNEASEIKDWSVVDVALERIGRYPETERDESGKVVNGCTWKGVWMDTNAPDRDHWIYKKFEVERPEGFEIFHQPPAVVPAPGAPEGANAWVANDGTHGLPAAENIQFLPGGFRYYLDMLPGKDYDRVKVMLCGDYGVVTYGRPVFPRYRDSVFWAPNRKDPKTGADGDVEILRGLPVILGIDPGIQWCACIFAQYSLAGQLRVIEELVLKDVSSFDFANTYIRAKLANTYRDMEVIAFCDPASSQRGQQTGRTSLDIFREAGLPVRPSCKQNLEDRLNAVNYFMSHNCGDEPGLLLGSRCPMLRKGFGGEYHFKRISSSSAHDEVFKAEPEKNQYSHPMDGLQYIAVELFLNADARSAAQEVRSDAYAGFNLMRRRGMDMPLPQGMYNPGMY